MRTPISVAVALSTLYYVVAQTTPRDDPTSLSSIIGPFLGPTLIFAPRITAYDFISAVGSDGTNDETTTYKVYHSSTLTNPENSDIPGDEKVGKQAYATVTIGPATFVEKGVLGATTIARTDEDGKQTSNVYSGGPMTTMCSYNSEPRKAVCTTTGTDAMEDASAMISEVQTLGGDRGWVSVYVLQDANAETTTTGAGGEAEENGSMTTAAGAAQTGSRSGSGTQTAQVTSTQAGLAAEVTAWVNAVVVVAAAAAFAM